MFVPGKPFQPSLMFACKAGAYSSEATFRCPTLEKAGKACQGDTLAYYKKRKIRRKKVL
jgi:hypothetical protein